jgi:hypothetical protein
MMTVARLLRKPRPFHAFTGLTSAEFDRRLQELELACHAHLRERHERPDRQRAIGGGRQGALPIAERLLRALVSLRLYVSQEMLSSLFDLDESDIRRKLSQRLLFVPLLVLPVPLRDAPLRTVPSTKDETKTAQKGPFPSRKEPLEGGSERSKSRSRLIRRRRRSWRMRPILFRNSFKKPERL